MYHLETVMEKARQVTATISSHEPLRPFLIATVFSHVRASCLVRNSPELNLSMSGKYYCFSVEFQDYLFPSALGRAEPDVKEVVHRISTDSLNPRDNARRPPLLCLLLRKPLQCPRMLFTACIYCQFCPFPSSVVSAPA